MESSKYRSARCWKDEFDIQRQISDGTPFLDRHAWHDGEVDPLVVFLQDSEPTASKVCEIGADDTVKNRHVESGSSTTSNSPFATTEKIQTGSSLPLVTKDHTSGADCECLKKQGNGHGKSNSILLREPVCRVCNDGLSNNVRLLYTRDLPVAMHQHGYIGTEIESTWIAGQDSTGTERTESRPNRRAAILMCSFFAAAGAGFYESSMGNMWHSNPRETTLLHSMERFGLDVLSLLVFSIATSTIYHINRRHRDQDYFVLGGIIAGALVGMYAYRELKDTLLKVLPWTILMSLVVSLVVHETPGVSAGGLKLDSINV